MGSCCCGRGGSQTAHDLEYEILKFFQGEHNSSKQLRVTCSCWTEGRWSQLHSGCGPWIWLLLLRWWKE